MSSSTTERRSSSRLPLPRQHLSVETTGTSPNGSMGTPQVFKTTNVHTNGICHTSPSSTIVLKDVTCNSASPKIHRNIAIPKGVPREGTQPLSPCPADHRLAMVASPRPYTSTPGHFRARSEQVILPHRTPRQTTPPFDPAALQADFNELRRCFADIAFTVARQESDIQALKEEIAQLKSNASRQI